ncbi:prepilin-type N-terminal cleavage/methylation domain-containing protein [[Erwinia] mediterraneensis]|uniref:prepilin-type N-terminal cleavage/methylation domain-containing protein n=1 Tax=[Erwinia] mediterraneensis TaxID=2161819 RepID=UPI001F1612B2|nr:prepilin-type N-terminal cleavage/methylation domain-containing protein [[Erwinia] mediterraneensis]
MHKSSAEQGFSLAETLFAILLLAMSISALLNYHRALSLGFSQQWYQQQAWRVAAQRVLGQETAGWRSYVSRYSGPGGCELEKIEVSGPYQRRATLNVLRCR